MSFTVSLLTQPPSYVKTSESQSSQKATLIVVFHNSQTRCLHRSITHVVSALEEAVLFPLRAVIVAPTRPCFARSSCSFHVLNDDIADSVRYARYLHFTTEVRRLHVNHCLLCRQCCVVDPYQQSALTSQATFSNSPLHTATLSQSRITSIFRPPIYPLEIDTRRSLVLFGSPSAALFVVTGTAFPLAS
ncbi:hypothetical protein PoB_006394100 [Plakobranchus ocellatus]|uniref:Uncharacterized protein n=1 Tax=Plakobranchus ocellatus TaxID=259542 RepID=A0AAV4CZQ7_9GAST|nr:hypothetical protein PoB_006394100 [Plakobranchus ocellatus]